VKSLKEDFPEVSHSVRITTMGARFRTEQGNEEQESETIHGYVLGADPDFFKMFNFPILQGNDKTPLIDPNGVYISEDFAQRLFGEENPIGKPIYFVNYEDKYVAGILKDPPINSHIRFSAILSNRSGAQSYMVGFLD